MKRLIFFLFSVLSVAVLSVSCSKRAVSSERMNEVVVYTYDSFIGEWGPGEKIAEKFREATGFAVTFVNCGDGAEVLSKAVLERNAPEADVLLGIDNNLVGRAREENVLVPYKPQNADALIPQELSELLAADFLITPYDHSKFALIFDVAQSRVPAPQSLEDLTKPEYAQKLIIMDPRTSTPGIGFVAWTLAHFGDDYENFWRALKPSILTMSPGWSAGYGLFTRGEAPLVVSYVTSPASHVYYDGETHYEALIFDEGHVEQIEGAGLVRGAANESGGKAFLDFLISDEAQGELPLTQWMYPANKNVVLPDCYIATMPRESKTLSYDADKISEAARRVIAILSE